MRNYLSMFRGKVSIVTTTICGMADCTVDVTFVVTEKVVN